MGCRNRRSSAGRPLARARGARARSRARPARRSRCLTMDEIERAKSEPVPDGRKPMPMLAPHAADAALAAAPERNVHRLTIDATLQDELQELARERAHALGPISPLRFSRSTMHGRGARARGFRRLFRQASRGPSRHDLGSCARRDRHSNPLSMVLALRGRPRSSRDLDRGSSGPLRRLCAGKLRSDLSRHGDGAPRIAALIERTGGGACSKKSAQAASRHGWNRQALLCVFPPGEVPGLAMGLGGVGVSSDRPCCALCRARPARHDGAARRADAAAEEAQPRADCSIQLPRGTSAIFFWHAAPGERGRRTHRVQDRHLIRISGCLGSRLRWHAHHRRVGWQADGAPVPGLTGRSAAAPHSVRCVCPHRKIVCALAGAAHGVRLLPRTVSCRRPCNDFLPLKA